MSARLGLSLTLKSEVEISVRRLSADIGRAKDTLGAGPPELFQKRVVFNCLDTLGQDTKAAGLRKRNHSTEKLATLVVLIEEASIDFYDVTRQPLKVTEIGMASAKIIDPQLDTKILQAEKDTMPRRTRSG